MIVQRHADSPHKLKHVYKKVKLLDMLNLVVSRELLFYLSCFLAFHTILDLVAEEWKTVLKRVFFKVIMATPALVYTLQLVVRSLVPIMTRKTSLLRIFALTFPAFLLLFFMQISCCVCWQSLWPWLLSCPVLIQGWMTMFGGWQGHRTWQEWTFIVCKWLYTREEWELKYSSYNSTTFWGYLLCFKVQ